MEGSLHLNPERRGLDADGTCLSQDACGPIHRAQGVNECFDEYENDVSHVLRPLQSLDLTQLSAPFTINE